MVAQKVTTYDKQTYGIVAEYSGLGDDETASGQICPACEGGATKERSLSVSRRGGVLLWHCHRASCGFRGSDGTASADLPSRPRKSTGGRINIRTSPLNKATIKFLATKFGIPESSFELAGLAWTGDGNGPYERRICYPIYSPDSRKRGESYRSYEGRSPKAIISLDDGAIASCWYKWKRASDILVIVEDQVSAIKLAPHYHSLALLGTNLSDAKVEEVKEGKYKYIYLCLDNDATYQAIKIQLERSRDLPNMRVMGLAKDIKNMNEVEFDEFMLRLI